MLIYFDMWVKGLYICDSKIYEREENQVSKMGERITKRENVIRYANRGFYG